MIGTDQVHEWLTRFNAQLKGSFAGHQLASADRLHIATIAHALIPQAALLGFSDFAELCTDLEQACLNGADLSALLEKTIKAAQDVRNTIERIETKLSQDACCQNAGVE